MKTLLLDVEEGKVMELDIENELEAFYEALGCDWIEIHPHKIGYPGIKFDTTFLVMCDEEGKLKDNPKISAIDSKGRTMFVGNLLFFRTDDEGELKELSDEDIKYLKRKIKTRFYLNSTKPHPILEQCDW